MAAVGLVVIVGMIVIVRARSAGAVAPHAATTAGAASGAGSAASGDRVVPVATAVQIGSPGVHTLELLDHDPSFDLVVVGSHGRTGLSRALLGSVAESVVRHAARPVLVARTRRA